MTQLSSAELTVPVSGMTCASCVSHLERAMKELPGVSKVVVSLTTNRAILNYDPARVSLEDVRRAVDHAGYAVPADELTLDVRGMTCASCAAHVEVR